MNYRYISLKKNRNRCYEKSPTAGADPEKWKERWLKWRTKGVSRNFQLINYSLGCVSCFVSIHVLLQLSVFYHHHEENEASYADWLSSKYLEFTLSEWWICISSCTLFTRMVCSSKSESAQRINTMNTAHPRGWLATQSPHPDQSLHCTTATVSSRIVLLTITDGQLLLNLLT